MLNIQQVNGAFTPVRERPVSHVAALAVLGALAFIAHEGIVAWVPGKLGMALTILFLAVSILQWLALGRREACEDERDTERADGVVQQAWIFGAIETALYAAGGLALLAKEGVDVYHVQWVALAAAIGAAAAFLNFRIKWVSCDPVSVRKMRPSNGGQSLQHTLFGERALPAADFQPADTARFTSDEGIVDFEEALRKRGEKAVNEVDPRLAASATRDAGERFKLWKKRERMRRARSSDDAEAVAA